MRRALIAHAAQAADSAGPERVTAGAPPREASSAVDRRIVRRRFRVRRRRRSRAPSKPGLLSVVRQRVQRAPGSAGMLVLYVALGVVCAGSVVMGVWLSDNDFVSRFAPNLATEALAALVTIAVVRRLLERQERARRLRGAVGALRKASRGLTEMVDAWARLIKGARGFEPPFPDRVEAMLEKYLTEELMYIDPRLACPDSAPEPCVQVLGRRLSEGRDQLREVIEMYGTDLEADYKEVLDELVDDPFLEAVCGLAFAPRLGPRRWRVALNTSRGHREAHFARLLIAMELHNTLAGEAARYRNRELAPRSDVLGIIRSLDHDMRVNGELSAEWWTAAPLPGSLRLARDAGDEAAPASQELVNASLAD
jgi:hypothetical protein